MKKLIFLIFLIPGLTVFSQTGTGWAQQRSKVNFKDSVNIANGWRIGGTDVTPSVTEINYVNGVTSAIQDQLDLNAADIDTLETDTIDIADIALDLDDYAVMLADSIADSTGNYVTQTQLNTHKADTTAITGFATQSDLNTTHFMKGITLMGATIKAVSLSGNIPNYYATLLDGAMYLSPAYLDHDDSITGIWYGVRTAGDFNQNNNNRIGLYKVNGDNSITLVASCANDSTIYDAAEYKQKAFTSKYGATKGLYYVGFLYNHVTKNTDPVLVANSQWTINSAMFSNGHAFSMYRNNTDLPASYADLAEWTKAQYSIWFMLY